MIAMKGTISIFIALLYFVNIGSAQFDEMITSGNNTGSYNISVALDHIFISKKNNSIEISEIVVFRNEGKEIYYSKDNHTFFAISTPPDIRNLKAQAMECCLVQDEGVVYMDPMQSIARGANFNMQISYALIPQDQKYVFNKSAIYNTTSISMFIDKKSGIDLEGSSEVMTLSGKEYNVIAFNNLRAGEMISIPIKIIPDYSGYLYAGIGLFVLLSIGLIYFFKEKIVKRRKKEYTLEELEIEKKNIFMTIHGFEKHAGPEISEEYQKLMEEYRQKAIRICIKIDNLKKTYRKDVNDDE
ncbi:MAG: hypothetical protein OIN86_02620 [Candidatus Methanoperedens sp.]|nr:hypothetical protein [Candidatus Methanoperedens sp.]CAG1002795.1 hypothetical protein METP1_03027 [Methanosarcinales archaeon]